MPTYAYHCNACHHEFEALQNVNARALRKCPVCLKSKLERLISGGAGFIFKGDGFYQTDYKKSSPPKGESSESKDQPTEKAEKKQDPAAAKIDL
jgi:putative FmdB family regulatory protein